VSNCAKASSKQQAGKNKPNLDPGRPEDGQGDKKMKGTDSGSRLRKAFAEASMSGMTVFIACSLPACFFSFADSSSGCSKACIL
jgi:hypothetical protein